MRVVNWCLGANIITCALLGVGTYPMSVCIICMASTGGIFPGMDWEYRLSGAWAISRSQSAGELQLIGFYD